MTVGIVLKRGGEAFEFDEVSVRWKEETVLFLGKDYQTLEISFDSLEWFVIVVKEEEPKE